MKNITKSLLFLSIFLILLFPTISFAGVLLETENLGDTEVTLKASGLVGQTITYFSVENDPNSPTTPPYSSAPPYLPVVFSDNSGFEGEAQRTFHALKPGSDYIGKVSYSPDPSNQTLRTINFKTTGTPLSSDNLISVFKINLNNEFLNGVISPNDILIEVPLGTDLTALVPIITLSDSKASISPASGVAQNFTNSVSYEVTAENGSKRDYSVLVVQSEIMISIITLTDRTVDFLGEYFPPNKSITFYVENYDDLGTPFYSRSTYSVTDDTGTATFSFTGLSPDGHYKYTTSEDPYKTGSFWTFHTSTPDPNPNPSPSAGGSTSDEPYGEKSNLIPCGTERMPLVTDSNGKQTGGEILNPCNSFTQLLTLVNNVVRYALFVLALPIAAILFAYAGFMLITSGGDTSKRQKAISTFKNVGIGLAIAAAAWLIISTILSLLGFDGTWLGF